MKVYSQDQIRQLDALAQTYPGLDALNLMQKAAMAAIHVIQRRFPTARSLDIVCGKGNNGGDGYALATLAAEYGYQVRMVTLCRLDQLHGAARQAAEIALSHSIPRITFNPHVELDGDLIVDALLGIGLNRAIEGVYAQAIEVMNRSTRPKIALDIPSGLDADRGHPWGMAVKAQATVTFVGRKIGLYTADGTDHAGAVFYADLDIPAPVFAQIESQSRVLDLGELKSKIPQRPANSHKNDYGNLLLVGGDLDYPGAMMLTAMAAARVGTGVIRVATRAKTAKMLVQRIPEVMAYSAKRLPELIFRSNVIAIGPGLGEMEWGRHLYQQTLESNKPKVIDASALRFLAQDPIRQDNWILTPHPGEAAALLKITPTDVQENRYAAVKALQSRYGGVVVLKGAGTLIANGREVNICNYGNPGMAKAGMGDVLTGVIAGLLAQGMSPTQAAETGVTLHAKAGDQVALMQGMRGLLPSDLMPVIQKDLG